MAELHKELRKRARKWIDNLPVTKGATRVGDRYNNDLLQFQELLLQTAPWRDLLGPIELIRILDRVSAFETRFPGEYEGPLGDIPVKGLADEIQADFVGFLESLPRSYLVCFQLPRMTRSKVPTTALADGITLIQTIDGLNEHLMLPKGVVPAPDVLLQEPAKLLRGTTYLAIEADGYANNSSQSYAVARAIGKLKQFLFLALTEKRLRRRGLADILNWIPYRRSEAQLDGVAMCHDDLNESYRIFIPDELAAFLRYVRINEDRLDIPEEKGDGTLSLRPAETDDEKIRAFASSLDLTRQFFELDSAKPDADRIRAAMEWWVDSEAVDNDTVAFLQACIGLEALLGDRDDRTRVKDKLSDRYAYILGKTNSEREELKKSFIAMYDHRSTIVHGRRARLGKDDTNAMVESRTMLSKAIQAEVANLFSNQAGAS